MSITFAKQALASCSVLALTLVSGVAMAAERGNDVSEVVVTAEKTANIARNVPISIDVIDQKTITNARVSNIERAIALLPDVQIGIGSGTSWGYISVRGVPPQNFGDPTTVVFVDGFTVGDSTSTNTLDLIDLQQVEVLKGPQGSLYGRNSMGGVINLISKKPSYQFEGGLQGTLASHGTQAFRGYVSLPLVADKLSVRFSAGTNSRDGFWPNLFTGEQHVGGTRDNNYRISIRANPTARMESILSYSHDQAHDDCGDCVNPVVGFNPVPPTNLTSGTLDFNHLAPYFNQNVKGLVDRRTDQLVWNNQYDAGTYTISSVTGYARLHGHYVDDFDRMPTDTFAPALGVVRGPEVMSQELRAASNGDTRLKWLVGAYVYGSKEFTLSTLEFPGFAIPLSITNGTIRNYSLFTNDSYAFTDRLRVGVGLRYDVERRNQTDLQTSVTTKVSSNVVLPKLFFLYKLDELNNIYGSVARGYKSGGLNFFGFPGYKPEFLWNYEIGYKGVTANRMFAYDLAAFFTDWKDQQVQQAAGFFTFITNAGKSQIYGVEANVHARPIEHLTLDAGLAYTHARYTDFVDGTSVPLYFGFNPDVSGNRLALTPDLSATLSAEYTQPIADGWDFIARGDLRYTGKRAIDTDGVMIANGYTLANLSLGVGNDHFRVTAFADNATDARYSTFAVLFAGIQPLTHLGAPRVAGVRVDAKF